MAGALLYIHAIVPVNISWLIWAVDRFQCDVAHLKTGYQKQQLQQDGMSGYNGWLYSCINNLLNLAIRDTDSMLHTINSLKASLPRVNEAPTPAVAASDEFR